MQKNKKKSLNLNLKFFLIFISLYKRKIIEFFFMKNFVKKLPIIDIKYEM